MWNRTSPSQMGLFELLRISMTMYKAKQDPEEFLQFLLAIKDRKLRIIVEIGTASAGTLFLWSALGQYDAHLISVDIASSEYASYVWGVMLRDLQTLSVIRGDSKSDTTYDEVVESLDGREVDLLYIDGSHWYEDVHADYLKYRGLVRPGGIIVLHDIGIRGREDIGVWKLWEEIKGDYRYDEYINSDPDSICGLGILYVGG